MTCGLGLLWLLACAEPAPAPAPAAPPAAGPVHGPEAGTPPELWRRSARIALDESGGQPFQGAAQALSACGTERPCVAERWVREDLPDEALIVQRSGDRVEVPGRGEGWRASWTSVSGPLRGCLGDPLAEPPAGDPTGLRQLQRAGDDWQWRLRLGGHNRCRLEGELVLQARADRADASALRCEGASWSDGGRTCALGHLRAFVRAQVLADWPDLPDEERVAWLALLEQDPEAAALVAELRGLDP